MMRSVGHSFNDSDRRLARSAGRLSDKAIDNEIKQKIYHATPCLRVRCNKAKNMKIGEWDINQT